MQFVRKEKEGKMLISFASNSFANLAKAKKNHSPPVSFYFFFPPHRKSNCSVSLYEGGSLDRAKIFPFRNRFPPPNKKEEEEEGSRGEEESSHGSVSHKTQFRRARRPKPP